MKKLPAIPTMAQRRTWDEWTAKQAAKAKESEQKSK